MNDLISRQAAIDALRGERHGLEEFMDYCLKNEMYGSRYHAKLERNRIDEDILILENLPTAEPKKGKWIIETGQYYQVLRCDQCGHVTVEQVRNYCPNCGAKMDGGTEWAR